MNTISVFFGSDKVYTGTFERNLRGLSLIDVFSTLDPVNLEDLGDELSQKAINQLSRNLSSINHKIEELNVILTNENAFWTIVPGSLDMNKSQLSELLELEVRKNFKSFSVDEFIFRVYPYGIREESDESEMLFVVFIKKKILESCENVLKITGLNINYITISQIAAQNTLEYNYPDTGHLYDLLINVDKEFCDICLSNDNITYYYDLLNINDRETLVEDIKNVINKLKLRGLSPGNILAIGNKLDKEFISLMNKQLSLETKRLNSFRLLRADIDKRLKDYCIRTSHLYAPVVGGALNSFDKGVIAEL